MVHTEECYSALKKEILPFVTWTNLKEIMLKEISQTQEEKHCMIDLTYRWNIKMSNSQKQKVDWWLPRVGR